MCGVVQCVPWLLAADPRRWRQEPPGSAFQGWSPGTSSYAISLAEINSDRPDCVQVAAVPGR